MLRTANRTRSFAALLFILLAIAAVAPHSVSAASGNPSYCDPGVAPLTNQNIQDKIPVIMVHGMNGKPSDWGRVNRSSSFAGMVNNIPGVAVAHLFKYDSSVWVDDPSSGPMLAKTIDCVSQLSQHNGGKGKVIIIGYSMGGLVAREALSLRSTDGQRAIADEVGQAITIGTPHIGAYVWTWSVFNPGSPELARLPHFPSQTIVHTIAGDVTRVYYDAQGTEIKREQPGDDTLVTTLSANAEYTINANDGGGSTNVSCEKQYLSLGWFNIPRGKDATCEHIHLIDNTTNGVRGDTVAAIKKYIAFLNAPTSVSLTIGGLTTKYDSRWTDASYGASGPGQDGSATDTTNGAACTNCTTTPNPTVYAFTQITNLASWCNGPILACTLGSSAVAGTAPPVTIGGLTPDSSARYYDSGYNGTSLVWCFETKKVCVAYRRGVDTPQLEPSAALLDVFNTATWTP